MLSQVSLSVRTIHFDTLPIHSDALTHICAQCSKALVSPQSSWNHRQCCKANAIKEEKLSNEQMRRLDMRNTNQKRNSTLSQILTLNLLPMIRILIQKRFLRLSNQIVLKNYKLNLEDFTESFTPTSKI